MSPDGWSHFESYRVRPWVGPRSIAYEMPELTVKQHMSLWHALEELPRNDYLEFASSPWSAHTRMKAAKLLAEMGVMP